MEKLTEKVAEFQRRLPEQKSEESYEGLSVIEEKPYTGPTSIKYWM